MKRRYLVIVTLLIIFVSVGFAGKVYITLERNSQLQEVREFHQALEDKIKEYPAKVGLSVKVLDFKETKPFFLKKEDFEFEHNSDQEFIAASVIKLQIMMACFQKIRDQEIGLENVIVLKKKMITGGSGVLKAYKIGTELTLEEILRLMISRSDNTAANIVVDIVGDDYRKEFFKTKGYNQTVLNRRIMDLYARKKGKENFTSCVDTEKVLFEIYKGYKSGDPLYALMMEFLLNQKVNDRLPKKLPTDVQVAHKTGLERNVVHDAGIVFSPNADYVICVFVQGEKSYKKSKAFIAEVSKLIYDHFNSNQN